MFVNLAYLINRPTGTTNYALNLLPYLDELSPTYLAAPNIHIGDRTTVCVSQNMTAASGSIGHLRRLGWTQFRLPSLIKKLACSNKPISEERTVQFFSDKATFKTPLLFTPIPEAPLSISLPLRTRTLRSVVTFHDLIPLRFPQEFGAIKHYYRYYVPQVLKQAEKVICNSEATARDIVDFYGIAAQKLVPIPLAYDEKHFRPTATRPDCLTQLSLDGKPYFLTLGRQAPYKNTAAVIEAIAHLPDCFLLVAGPTDSRYTHTLKKLAEEKGVRSRIKFLSYVPYAQLPSLFSHAVALVFPSLWEGFGLPVLEAMACGTPVITSNLASLPEVTGTAAYLIDPYRLDEMVAAMGAVINDSGTREQLSVAGLERVSYFSWQKTGRATVDVLSAIA